ncbi:hypothetical protein KL938_003570 [Ogataea parapolymorpha]|nr:hypothetical protein KL938_003570 [Ogataea parapolymorpha]
MMSYDYDLTNGQNDLQNVCQHNKAGDLSCCCCRGDPTVEQQARTGGLSASNPVYSDSAVSSAKDDCYIFGRNADQIRLEEFFKGGSRPPTGLSEGHAEPIRDSLPAETGLSHICADVAGVILMYFVATYGRVQSPKSEW